MKPDFFFTIPDYHAEGSNQSPCEFRLISIKIKIEKEDFFSTLSNLSLFDESAIFRSLTREPRFEIAHDDTWDDFGRAYYDSRDYQFTEFHVSLCSVDELKQQIEAKMRELDQNSIISVPCIFAEEPHSSIMEHYFAENQRNKDLLAWIEDFKAKNIIAENIWEADDHHSCHPYQNKLFYLHQLAKLSLCGTHPQAKVAARPCCRSFLMASCRQLSGDDLLGH